MPSTHISVEIVTASTEDHLKLGKISQMLDSSVRRSERKQRKLEKKLLKLKGMRVKQAYKPKHYK